MFLGAPAALLRGSQGGGLLASFCSNKELFWNSVLLLPSTLSQCAGKDGEMRAGQPLGTEGSGFKSCSALGHSMLLPLWEAVFSSVLWRPALLPCQGPGGTQ